MLSEEKRLYSWLLQAKRLRQAPAPGLVMPSSIEGGGKHAREQRVLGEVFEVPCRRAGCAEVGAWAEHEADSSASASRAMAAPMQRMSSASQPQRRSTPGKTGRGGVGAVHAEHVPGALPLAQAVRPVRHHERAKAKFRHGPRQPATAPSRRAG